jgi:hypothetical protein
MSGHVADLVLEGATAAVNRDMGEEERQLLCGTYP